MCEAVRSPGPPHLIGLEHVRVFPSRSRTPALLGPNCDFTLYTYLASVALSSSQDILRWRHEAAVSSLVRKELSMTHPIVPSGPSLPVVPHSPCSLSAASQSVSPSVST